MSEGVLIDKRDIPALRQMLRDYRNRKPVRKQQRKRWPVGGGGSSSFGGGFILFQPVEICPGIGFACDCVVGRVEIASCGLGLAKDDEVTVWDASGSWLQMPDSILFASYFYAQKMAFDPEPYTNPATNGCSFIVTGAPCVEPSFL